jgi:NAD(P)-dependent dehydrogenase (short-subunit alcohol dehydrogenase family)
VLPAAPTWHWRRGVLSCRRRSKVNYRRCLVTGATSGIGAAFARELPAQTALLLTGRNRERLDEMRAVLGQPGREVDCVQADLAFIEDRDKLISRAEAFGIDLLINNAGLGPYGPVLQNDVDFERTAAEVNVVATVDLTRRLVPAMISRAKETGRRAGLINVSSTLAFSTYALSRHLCREQNVHLDVHAGAGGRAPIQADRCVDALPRADAYRVWPSRRIFAREPSRRVFA